MWDKIFDGKVHGNKIIRHYEKWGRFTDLSVDETIAKGLNQYQDWLCSAGVQHFYVDFDGWLFRGNCRVGDILGNVYKKDYEIPNSWVSCPYSLCGCGADILAPKMQNKSQKTKLKNTFAPKTPYVWQRRKKANKPVAVETAFPNTMKRVQWDIGRRCNYDCSYCWPNVHNSTEALKSYEMMKSAVDRFVQKVSPNDPMVFMFGGGEPTLYPKFDRLIKELFEQGHQITVTTNGSRNAKYFADLIMVCNINLSVHFESANWDRLLKNIAAMIDKRRPGGMVGGLEVKLMVPPGVMEKAKKFRDEMFKIPDFENYVNWSFVPIRNMGKEGESPVKSAILKPYEESEFKNFENQL